MDKGGTFIFYCVLVFFLNSSQSQTKAWVYKYIILAFLAYLHSLFQMIFFSKSLLSHIQKSLLFWILNLLWPSYNFRLLFLLLTLECMDYKDYSLLTESCYHDLTLFFGYTYFFSIPLIQKVNTGMGTWSTQFPYSEHKM